MSSIRTHPGGERDQTVGPVRTCIGCGTRGLRAEMIRVAAYGGSTQVDPHGILPGRGAWFHLDPTCITKARQRKQLARRLRLARDIDSELWDELDRIVHAAAHGAPLDE